MGTIIHTFILYLSYNLTYFSFDHTLKALSAYKAKLNFIRTTTGRGQSKTFILFMNVNQKLLETEFSIAICRPNGDIWQWKKLILMIFWSALVDC